MIRIVYDEDMNAWLKFITVWLVALALPVQAMAGLAMANCALASHPAHTMAVCSDHAPGGHVHGAADVSHLDGLDVPDTADQAAPADPQRQDIVADLGQHKCSACASCCSAYAILSAVPRVPAPELVAALFVAVVPTVAPFATDGPDRPPRTERA